MRVTSRNGKWLSIDPPAPLRQCVKVYKSHVGHFGWSIARVIDEEWELVGGVWENPPDITDYASNTLVGHTGQNWQGDQYHVDSYRKRHPKKWTDES